MKKQIKPFEIYRDSKKKYRWKVTANNGLRLAVSSESYTRKIDCINSAVSTKKILVFAGPQFNMDTMKYEEHK
jgi:uncharacterized protein YegP (UPF0339 family)